MRVSPFKEPQEKETVSRRRSLSVDECELSKYEQQLTAEESFEERLKKKIRESSSKKSKEKERISKRRSITTGKLEPEIRARVDELKECWFTR